MPRIARQAFFANAAARVDFADDAFADQVRRVRRFFDDADEFVSDRARKSGVTAHDFEIGIADSRLRDADQGFPIRLSAWQFRQVADDY